ncbi:MULTISPECIES: 4-hydroxy-tetrahydrodipicolinate reductase [Flavobacteriaceae]|uniref:4-hydroxy-tetrahydrodipicolinate reductase n=1 Tax=Flavobacteriaceae TaxID=49546 RepID=UPI0010ADF60F|nr:MULTISPECIES: 4-hydroxy-tetrahydrodipicolinate reductase [Flavobacteriaceae]NJB37650.1 4-hydroxy-tetrahydrodipicolinate reductase [Croceivirga sp. JEA036]TKD62479.1 4-hydroxy-tetrahydrodipicolinate reductase [Flavobacterium sp. ASW18X]
MNIALFGYGKMGRMLEKIGTERGHTIIAKVDLDTDVNQLDFDAIDVAIDFSTPDAAFNNISLCFEKGIPVVSGTTGWLAKYEEAIALCSAKNGAFIYGSNFSLGVNLFFELNQRLAQMMNGFKDYHAHMEEIHHVHKIDAPSGTAITLAEGIIANSDYSGWQLVGAHPDEIAITSIREGEVPGTHIIKYDSDVDSIEIKHTAHNRNGFAMGAIIAAEWLQGKTGVYSMKDVLNLS